MISGRPWAVTAAAVLILAGCSTSGGARSAPPVGASPSTPAPVVAPSSADQAASTAVPVVECPTSRGLPGRPATKLPEQIALSNVTPSQAARLAYYSDDVRSLDPILAPRGWSCHAGVGVDGSVDITVSPAGSGSPTFGIDASSAGACQGCVYDAVCGLVTNAGKVIGYSDLPCTAPTNAAELVHFEQGSRTASGAFVHDVIAFEDPAGVKGTGWGSGGAAPANGVVLFDRDDHGASESTETCTLAESEHSVCTVILNDFVTSAWLMHG